jgi:hypothetical protein
MTDSTVKSVIPEEVMRRYVQRRASPEEEERIELAMMDNPRLLDAVMVDQALVDGLVQGIAEPLPRYGTGPGAESRPINWAMAAAILMGVGAAVSGAGWIQASHSLQRFQAEAANATVGHVAVVMVATERGTASAVHVPRGDPSIPVLFEVPLSPPFASRYRLELSSTGASAPEYAVEGLTPQAGGLLAALVPRRNLKAGEHSLRVVAADTQGEHELMQIDVVAD